MPSSELRVLFFDLGETFVRTADRSWGAGGTRSAHGGAIRGPAARDHLEHREPDPAQLAGRLPTDFDWAEFESSLVILSSEAGAEKPSPEIFRKAIAAAGVAPPECLFCTEDLTDTLAAQPAGELTARVQRPPHSDLGDLLKAATRTGLLTPSDPG